MKNTVMDNIVEYQINFFTQILLHSAYSVFCIVQNVYFNNSYFIYIYAYCYNFILILSTHNIIF